MNKDNQINDMSEIITKTCEKKKFIGSYTIATVLYNAGYRKQSENTVEVVRCKDCEYYKQNPYSLDKEMMCMCWADWLPTDADDFCSYGKMKGGTE